MQRPLTVSLVALQCVVACGYAVEAQGANKRPAFAHTSASHASAPAHDDAVATHDAAPQPAKHVDEVTLRLTPRFVSAPGFLRSLIRVVPNADNRVLRVAIDSDGYYRSSDIELDGESAPESHFFDWKEVPAGHYDLVVTVIGQTGPRAVRHLTFQVLGVGADGQDR